ncbi:hypothetical protein QBC47DRAFT_43424 [Echria macrotheca]|uniref:Secreted protein n=1 Tax=Echria macrotheca TaxID=438768 RepID=A0AAJ0B8I0_9PEZI|nr:hypothetical protein QBC47DRAFT_43424 [Echria macrotheca]
MWCSWCWGSCLLPLSFWKSQAAGKMGVTLIPSQPKNTFDTSVSLLRIWLFGKLGEQSSKGWTICARGTQHRIVIGRCTGSQSQTTWKEMTESYLPRQGNALPKAANTTYLPGHEAHPTIEGRGSLSSLHPGLQRALSLQGRR